MEHKTVRELSGEIWAEFNHYYWKKGEHAPFPASDVRADIATGSLARHIGKRIENDKDLPAELLPVSKPTGEG